MHTPYIPLSYSKTGVYRGIECIPLTSHFHIVKLGFVTLFLIFALKHRLCVPAIYVLSKVRKNKKNQLKIVIFTAVKIAAYCMGVFA